MQFKANKDANLAYACHIPQDKLFMKDLLILSKRSAKDLCLQYGRSFNFHDQVICQITNANKTNGTIAATLPTANCKLMLGKSHGIPQAEYF